MPKNEEYVKKLEQFWPFDAYKEGMRRHWEWLKRWLLANVRSVLVVLTILVSIAVFFAATTQYWLPVISGLGKQENQPTNSTKVDAAVAVPIKPIISQPNKSGKNASEGKKTESEYGNPLIGKVVVSYGLIYSENYQDYRFHKGIDIMSTQDDLVKAIQDGIVTKIEQDAVEGWQITVKHESGLFSLYAGITSPEVIVNQKVKKGQNLCKVEIEKGILHFAVFQGKKDKNPLSFVSY